jgi:hypothetical protein
MAACRLPPLLTLITFVWEAGLWFVSETRLSRVAGAGLPGRWPRTNSRQTVINVQTTEIPTMIFNRRFVTIVPGNGFLTLLCAPLCLCVSVVNESLLHRRGTETQRCTENSSRGVHSRLNTNWLQPRPTRPQFNFVNRKPLAV